MQRLKNAFEQGHVVLARVFQEKHLTALDAEETPQEEETHWST